VQRARLACAGVLLLGLSLAPSARAVNSCNGLLTIDYVAGPGFAIPGDVIRVRLSLGTASIQGGTKLTIHRVRFDLDCNDNNPLGVPCTDEGSIVEYEGDGTITTTCPGTVWTTGHGTSDAPNEVVFTPTVPVDVPPNQAIPPGFCVLEFDVKVLGPSVDTTPNAIQQATGYIGTDASCDNGLQSTGSQSSSIPLCPTCTGTQCSTSACNQDIGQCVSTPLPSGTPCDLDNNKCTTDQCDSSANCAFVGNVACAPAVPPCEGGQLCDPPTGNCVDQPDAQDSTPCADTDGSLCTTAGCDGLGNCSQTHMTTVCPPDTNDCTQDPPCNPQTGMCDHPPTPASTPCLDTDNDTCTTAGCDGQGTCNQSHVVCVTTTTSTTSSTTTSTSNTTTTSVTSTTSTTVCVPVQENCSNMVDDDCDGLVDCLDPDCPPNGMPCPTAKKDPTDIRFTPGLDRLRTKAVLEMPQIDLTTVNVGVLLTNPNQTLYSAERSGSVLHHNGKIWRFTDVSARTSPTGGLYSLKIKEHRDGNGYSASAISYADLSAAEGPAGDPKKLERMRVQFYIGDVVFITIDTPWARTPTGWRAPKDH
jgi:hypothetical protein